MHHLTTTLHVATLIDDAHPMVVYIIFLLFLLVVLVVVLRKLPFYHLHSLMMRLFEGQNCSCCFAACYHRVLKLSRRERTPQHYHSIPTHAYRGRRQHQEIGPRGKTTKSSSMRKISCGCSIAFSLDGAENFLSSVVHHRVRYCLISWTNRTTESRLSLSRRSFYCYHSVWTISQTKHCCCRSAALCVVWVCNYVESFSR